MSLCIIRFEENPDRQTMLPGRYNDHQQAELAIKQVLAEYKKNGYDAQHDYWWAHDAGGNKFKFWISVESEGAA
jgi:hypothetical protein